MTTEQMETYRDRIVEVLRQQSSAAGIEIVECPPFEPGEPLPICLCMLDGEALVLELNVA